MEETKREKVTSTEPQRIDVQSLVKQAVEEYTRAQQAKAEPAYRAELQEERKRREQLAGCGKTGETSYALMF